VARATFCTVFSVRRIDGELRLFTVTDKPNACIAVGLPQGIVIDFDDAVGPEELETLLPR
jgi:hypothetical protein